HMAVPTRIVDDDVERGGPDAVVADKQIEAAIPVVVQERGARREPRVAHSCPPGDVRERAVPVVVEEEVRPQRGEVEVGPAVVVVVAHSDTHPVAIDGEAGLLRDIVERAVASVPVERRMKGTSAGEARKPGRVDEEEIEATVVVVVEKGAARAKRLRQIEAAAAPALVPEGDSCAQRDI